MKSMQIVIAFVDFILSSFLWFMTVAKLGVFAISVEGHYEPSASWGDCSKVASLPPRLRRLPTYQRKIRGAPTKKYGVVGRITSGRIIGKVRCAKYRARIITTGFRKALL